MSFSTILLINVGVLAMVLLSDLGRREFSRRRLLRPLLVAGGVGATTLHAVPGHGDGLTLVVAGVAAGVALGALAGGLLRVEQRADGTPGTVAGAGYAALWITVVGARIAFSYGADHWFHDGLGTWMMAHQVTADALTDALVLMALAMVVTRTLSILARIQLSQGSAARAAVLAR
ncbi:hypothetical protein [Patulibacter minatonensis]|uniref:hypothetical protein n=1 Tax=Patulibacter minatonensis TaxID=298163 RepID=UPI0004AEBE72|nr:hypothetical protein [Patulibacter minatonensis]